MFFSWIESLFLVMNRLDINYLCHCRSHLTARLGTATAGFSTPLAVVMVMFRALNRTAIARFGANTT